MLAVRKRAENKGGSIMGEEKVLYSVKMRSSLGGAHGVGGQHIS